MIKIKIILKNNMKIIYIKLQTNKKSFIINFIFYN